MTQAAVSVEGVSKLYRLGLIGGGTLRDDVARWTARLMRKPDPLLKVGQEDHGNRSGDYLWALRDVSLEVERGKVLGIIGGNGAGKSTLLKILSRVTAPTEGVVRIKGHLASLLEVGTGFHPELTGRENIYLNGAILGMRRADTRRRLEEIVEFAEVGEFLDTPVKRYSSGMYVRLAFAVAAHLDPDILVVDEVLAVGDLAFQDKCLRKMRDVSESARTVLFVSHNMGAVRRLCSSAVLLEKGRVAFTGQTDEAVALYERRGRATADAEHGRFERDLDTDPPERDTWVQAVELQDREGIPRVEFEWGEELRIVFELAGAPAREGMTVTWILEDERGAAIAWANSSMLSGFHLRRGETSATCRLPRLPLAIGRYTLTVSGGLLNSPERKDFWRGAARFQVTACDPYGVMADHDGGPGAVVIDQEWFRGKGIPA